MKYCAIGFTPKELQFIHTVLNHEWSWGVPFVKAHKSDSDTIVMKVPGKEIDTLFEKHKQLHGLSVCDRGSTPIKIYLRKENWDAIPPLSGYRNLDDYRIYLVLHEFGHALGYDHAVCRGSGYPADVMQQQTILLTLKGNCYPDPWVKKLF